MDVAIVGGTGAEGFGLALRLARAGHHAIIGSRSAERGAAKAREAVEILGGGTVSGASNEEAASAGVVFVTVPFEGQAEIYRSIKTSLRQGSVVCDATSPLATAVGGRAWHVLRPWHGSAAEQAAAIVGDGPRIVAGFHTIAAESLRELDAPVDSDVVLCGDEADAKRTVGDLIAEIPRLRWVDGGLLSQARIVEPMTALLVSINRAYKVRDSGFRITGRDTWGDPSA